MSIMVSKHHWCAINRGTRTDIISINIGVKSVHTSRHYQPGHRARNQLEMEERASLPLPKGLVPKPTQKKTRIKETTGTTGSPGTKGYTGYLPSEKYSKYRSDLARIIKKTTGYELVDLEPIEDDTIKVNDNEINTDNVDDKNIASTKRHNELEKDFKKMNESNSKKSTVKEIRK